MTKMGWPSIVALLLVAGVVSQSSHPSFSLRNRQYAGIQFQRRGLYPQTSLTLSIEGGYFNQSLACAELLAREAVYGPGWSTGLIVATDIGFSDPTVESSNSSTPFYRVLSMRIEGDDSFRSEGVYFIRVPVNCTFSTQVSDSFFQAANFSITQDRRSAIGRLSTFIVLLSVGTSVIAALLGSSVPLLLTQLLALMLSPACGPIVVQEEFSIVQYILVPFDFRPIVGDLGVAQPVRFMMVAIFVMIVVCCFECVRYVIETYCCCRDSTVEVDNFGLPLRSVNAGLTPQQPVDPTHNVAEEDVPRVADERWAPAAGALHDYRGAPIPPHYCFVFLLALMLGATHFSISAAFSGTSSLAIAGVALVCVVVFAIGTVALSMSVTRDAAIFWCPYTTQRGSIPSLVQPEGVWGPNAMRERNAPWLCSWRKGCKGMSPFVYLLGLFAALMTSTTPNSNKGALLQMGLLNVSVALLFLLFVLLRPFRVPVCNVLYTGALAATFSAAVLQSVHVSGERGAEEVYTQESDALTSYAVGVLVSTVIGGLLLTMAGLCEFAVRMWELRRGRERRAGREGERLRRQRLLQGSTRASKIERQQFQTLIVDMMNDIVQKAQKDDDGADLLDLNAGAAQRSRQRTRAVSVWRQGHHDVIASDANPPSLAEYLVQDFDAMPLETREEMLLADEQDAKRQGQRGRSNMHSTVVDAASYRKPDYVQHAVPPCLSTMSVEVDKHARASKPDYDL